MESRVSSLESRGVRAAAGCAGRRGRARRGGFALLDVIIGGILLAIGLAVILSLNSRALEMIRRAEQDVVAASLMDELLSTVLAEGPVDFNDLYDHAGGYDEPFQDWEYEIDVDDQGEGMPFRVTALLRHRPDGKEYVTATLIAALEGEEPWPQREPLEPIDRESRYEEEY